MRNALLFGLLVLLSQPAASYDAYLNPQGRLRVPAISVGGAAFGAELQLSNAQPLHFSLTGHHNLNSQTEPVTVYDAAAQQIRLSKALYEGGYYDVLLQLDGSSPDIRFELVSVTPAPYRVDRGGSMFVQAVSYGSDSYFFLNGEPRPVFPHYDGDAVYKELVSRRSATAQEVVQPYIVNEAETAGGAKAILILISGGDYATGLEGDPVTGKVRRSGGSTLTRCAHLFARLGFKAVTLQRPSDYANFLAAGASLGNEAQQRMDYYRVSDQHRQDVQAVLAAENQDELPVFIIGHSRGGVSAAALNDLARGVGLISPVTLGKAGNPVGQPYSSGRVQAAALNRPALITYHSRDACGSAAPAGSMDLYDAYISLGKDATLIGFEGGFLFSDVVCQSRHYHGYVGIETTLAAHIGAWIDSVLAD